MIAGGSYATYTLASKRLLEDGHAPEGVMAALFGLGAVALAPRAVPRRTRARSAAPRGSRSCCSSASSRPRVAYVLFARGLRGLHASEAATITLRSR